MNLLILVRDPSIGVPNFDATWSPGYSCNPPQSVNQKPSIGIPRYRWSQESPSPPRIRQNVSTFVYSVNITRARDPLVLLRKPSTGIPFFDTTGARNLPVLRQSPDTPPQTVNRHSIFDTTGARNLTVLPQSRQSVFVTSALEPKTY